MGDPKKAAAAIAAVLHFIKTEQAAMAMPPDLPAAAPTMPPMIQAPAPVTKPWGLSGRQAQMQMRNLMQLRLFGK